VGQDRELVGDGEDAGFADGMVSYGGDTDEVVHMCVVRLVARIWCPVVVGTETIDSLLLASDDPVGADESVDTIIVVPDMVNVEDESSSALVCVGCMEDGSVTVTYTLGTIVLMYWVAVVYALT
jgi:hypothetical protein